MAYLVLARKYRPQAFADMTGQEHVVQTLTNALKSGRVAHALLFCGPRGCGKTTTARIVAKALNCEQGPTPTPCGVCTPCREITAGSDVDVQEIDAASNTGVDNVRELRESAKYLPARDRFKIFIVDEVHMLSKAAFNAFLKTLEEPPGHVKFLFATTDPQALPETILSRCQRHNFRLVPLKQIAERIRAIAKAENVTIDDGAVSLVARQAAGSMRDALSLLDQVFSSCGEGTPITAVDAAQALGALDRSVIARIAGALLARDAKAALDGVAQAYDGGHDLKRLAEDLATHLRNLVAASISGVPLDLPDHELKALRDQAATADPVEIVRLFDLVHESLFDVAHAVQPRHAVEIALLRGIYLAPSTSVQALITRADEIARKLGGEPPPAPGPGPGRGSPPPSRPRPALFEAPPGSPVRSAPAPAPETRFEAPSPPVAMAAAAPAAIAQPAQPPPAPAARPAGKPWERHLSLVPSPADAPQAPPVEAPAPPVAMPAAAPVAVPPPPPPAAAQTPALPADTALMARWPSIVEGVRATRRVLASFLDHARPMSLAEGELTLGFTRGDIYAEKVKAERSTLEATFREVLQAPVRLKILELQAGEGASISSVAETNDRAEREAREARLKTGREHPAIQRAVAVLGAEIEDVRDLGGGSGS
jgi:DNA polymerase-3 subunit gamma/tau